VQANRGRLDPDQYAQFRQGLNEKYGFGVDPAQAEALKAEAARLNESVAQGRNLNLAIPPVDAAMDGQDRFNASVFNNKYGAAAMGAASLAGGADEAAGAIRALMTGSPLAVEINRANAMRQAAANEYPKATLLGNVAGSTALGLATGGLAPAGLGTALGTTRGILGAGAGFGAVNGALENNENRAMGGLIGAGAGLAGGAAGKYAVAPVAERIARTGAGQAIGNAVQGATNAITGRNVAREAVPVLSPLEAGIESTSPDLTGVVERLRQAAGLNLPMALADADPKLRMLGGAVARKSVDARSLAEQTFDPRALGQADRARESIDQYLAPITDIEARQKDLIKAGNIASEPYYTAMRGQQAPTDPDVMALLNTPAGADALKRAREIAQNSGRSPEELGFIIDDSGNVGLPGMEGRFTKATAANPMDQFSPETLRTFNGGQVTKAAPTDLIGWLRLNGGLRENGGELSAMGLTNGYRPGVDLKGKETQFGPIVNNTDGMNMDDAARAAWEAGYFPELNDRPDINTFMNAVREGHDGVGTPRYRAEDQSVVADYYAALEEKQNLDRMRGEFGQVWNDTATDAGPDRPFAPIEAYGEKEVQLPTFETLDLVKRGFDARLNEARDPFGKLDLQGNPQLQAIDGLRGRFVGRLDQLNENYPKARAEYAKYAKRSDALSQGMDLTKPSLPQRQFDRVMGDASAYDGNFRQDADMMMPELQRGYATGMADTVGKARLSGNPYDAIYGSPNQQQRVGTMFPQGADRFGQVYDIERDMGKTYREVLGGSPTAGRLQADDQLNGGLGTAALDVASNAMTGGGLSAGSLLKAGRNIIGDSARLGIGEASRKRADQIAATLFDTSNPAYIADMVEALTSRVRKISERKASYGKGGGLLGALSASSAVAPSGS